MHGHITLLRFKQCCWSCLRVFFSLPLPYALQEAERITALRKAGEQRQRGEEDHRVANMASVVEDQSRRKAQVVERQQR